MNIDTHVVNNSAMITMQSGTVQSRIWLGPEELAQLFGNLCRWKNCKCLIEGDRLRFLTDGEHPPEKRADVIIVDLLNQVLELCTKGQGIPRGEQ